MATTRAKFTCTSNHPEHGMTNGAARIELMPVYSDDAESENRAFWQATPSGTIILSIVNPAAAADFQPGREYYVDFTPAD